MQTSDYQASDYIEANRRAWNQVAPIHAAINQERLLRSFAEPGFSLLDDVERRGRIDAGETAKGDETIVVGAREVLRPPAAESAIPEAAAIAGVVAEAAEEEFGRDGKIRLIVGLKAGGARSAEPLPTREFDGGHQQQADRKQRTHQFHGP